MACGLADKLLTLGNYIQIFYNDQLSQSVTVKRGFFVSKDKDFVTIKDDHNRRIAIPLNRIIRIEEGDYGN